MCKIPRGSTLNFNERDWWLMCLWLWHWLSYCTAFCCLLSIIQVLYYYLNILGKCPPPPQYYYFNINKHCGFRFTFYPNTRTSVPWAPKANYHYSTALILTCRMSNFFTVLQHLAGRITRFFEAQKHTQIFRNPHPHSPPLSEPSWVCFCASKNRAVLQGSCWEWEQGGESETRKGK